MDDGAWDDDAWTESDARSDLRKVIAMVVMTWLAAIWLLVMLWSESREPFSRDPQGSAKAEQQSRRSAAAGTLR